MLRSLLGTMKNMLKRMCCACSIPRRSLSQDANHETVDIIKRTCKLDLKNILLDIETNPCIFNTTLKQTWVELGCDNRHVGFWMREVFLYICRRASKIAYSLHVNEPNSD